MTNYTAVFPKVCSNCEDDLIRQLVLRLCVQRNLDEATSVLLLTVRLEWNLFILQKDFVRRNNCVTWLRIILVHVSVVNNLFADSNHRCGYEWIARITVRG